MYYRQLSISSPEHFGLIVSFYDQLISYVHPLLSVMCRQQFPLNDNSSYTTWQILAKHLREVS